MVSKAVQSVAALVGVTVLGMLTVPGSALGGPDAPEDATRASAPEAGGYTPGQPPSVKQPIDCQTECDDKYQDCIDRAPSSCLRKSGGKTKCQQCWERCNAGDSPSDECRKCLF
jgi:hypothetical protein